VAQRDVVEINPIHGERSAVRQFRDRVCAFDLRSLKV
jgi:hypothetical protein